MKREKRYPRQAPMIPAGELLSGSVHLEWRRCGETICRCASGRLHGPYYVLRWREAGRQRKKLVRPQGSPRCWRQSSSGARSLPYRGSAPACATSVRKCLALGVLPRTHLRTKRERGSLTPMLRDSALKQPGWLDKLNSEQRLAATHGAASEGSTPLLIIAGAG